MRIIKEPEERRCEIITAAEQLFITKGYKHTTIIDILDAVKIAKGTFYYYYKSKEEVLDAVIEKIVMADVAKAKKIADREDLTIFEKIFAVFTVQQPQEGDVKQQMIEQFHEPGNAEMHQKSNVRAINELAPVLAGIIQDGINQGILDTPFPQETIELLLVASFIFDAGYFKWTQDEQLQRIKAFIVMLEKVLGAPQHSFDFIFQIILNGES